MTRLTFLRDAYALFQTDSRADTGIAVILALAALLPFLMTVYRARTSD